MSDSANVCAFCHGHFWDRPGVTETTTLWGPTEESRQVTYWFCDDRCREHWLTAHIDGLEPGGTMEP